MKSKLFLLFVMITGIFTNAFAQKKDVEGYYVTMNGDTVKGVLVKYVRWNESPGTVRFRNSNGDETAITPATAKMFMANGQYPYYAYKGVRHLNNKNAGEMEIHAFLEMIFESGDTRLFEFKDSLRANYFIQTNDQPLTELLY